MKAPNKKQRSKIQSQKMAMRDSLWPGMKAEALWDWGKSDGWLNIPRAMPLLLRIMDLQSKGKPLSGTYLDLWCRTFNDGFVIANKPREMAFFAGFAGERAERTWSARMRTLEQLGYIEIKPGPSGAISYVLILNPYHVIRGHHEAGRVDRSSWNALMEKMIEIRATDLQEAEEPAKIEAEADDGADDAAAAAEPAASMVAPAKRPTKLRPSLKRQA